ncbi:MAG TPA: efflux RND transporter permease subunit [Bryobacteraceae bacterium]|nr:efflux RND transporter permease subunit [Bryobacteraceae bacterium]HOQ44865.1 efflux RND transporter permease subunit [Bryobacteraceae bacterium]HPU72124.1 efflux RND transporter permease subunit [Bryobacteraceae bacterium]
MFLSDLSIRQPVLATMLSVTLVALGIYSYRELSIDLMPDVEIPVLTIQTVYPGASPVTVEREVTKRIEEAVNTISGVRHVSSTTTEGLSVVVVEFRLGTKIETAQQDAQAKINAIRSQFPADMEEPVIQRIDFNAMPVVSLAVESETADIKTLSSLAEKVIKKRLETVPGVGQVNLVGLARREIQILVDREKLRAYGLTYAHVANALRRENMDVPAGKLEQGEREPLVRVSGRFRSVDGFKDLIVAVRNGRPIFLPEVARVVDGVEERRSAALINDRPGLALDIVKQSGANTVEVVDGINAAVDVLNKELPAHIRLRPVVDRSIFIRDSVEDVKTTLLIGGLLTILIVFLFLNSWRSTVITGLALPVSVISTFIIMRALGFTLNVLTLMGLSLAIGLLIDDAIVVRENIVRHMHQGVDHFTAAREATAEIGLAVIATTFTIIAVFVPVAFMGGIIGRFFYQFGITVGFAVLVSLYVSFTLDPMLSSRWYDPASDPTVPRSWLGRWLEKLNNQVDRLRNVVAAALGWSLSHRWAVVLIATVAIFSSFALFGRLGSAFMPEADPGQFQVSYKADPSISLDRSIEIARQLVAEIRANPAVDYTYTTIGGISGQPINEGAIFVRLKDRKLRPHYLEIKAEMRERLKRFRAVRTAVVEADQMQAESRPVQLVLRGQDLTRMVPLSRRLLDEVRAVPGTTDIDTSEEEPRPEVRVEIDRRAAGDLGLDLGTVASTVRGLVAGEVVSQFEDPDGDSYDVRLRVDSSQRVHGADLLGIDLPGRNGGPLIPLAQVARIESGVAPSKIRHLDLMREIRISANTQGRSLGEVVADIQERLANVPLPPGHSVGFTGEYEDMRESFGYVVQSLVLAILLIYAILASQFRSFLQPLAIMLSLPLSLVGVAGMLYLVGDTMNMMSMIGLILLMGLVTKNAILLVDFANVQRRAGTPRRPALIEAARVRLRPIIMTTLAMIFGMLPLAFEWGAGAEFRAPMARAVIGGLITSTLLTLLVVPVVYTFLDDIGTGFARWWHRKSPAARRAMAQVAE